MTYALWIVQVRFLGVAEVLGALLSLVVGLLAAFVAYGRWRLAPHRRSPHQPAMSGIAPLKSGRGEHPAGPGRSGA
jgi:hypothetical protein